MLSWPKHIDGWVCKVWAWLVEKYSFDGGARTHTDTQTDRMSCIYILRWQLTLCYIIQELPFLCVCVWALYMCYLLLWFPGMACLESVHISEDGFLSWWTLRWFPMYVSLPCVAAKSNMSCTTCVWTVCCVTEMTSTRYVPAARTLLASSPTRGKCAPSAGFVYAGTAEKIYSLRAGCAHCALKKSECFCFFFLRSSIWGVAYVTVFKSSATWVATFRLRGYKSMLVIFKLP